MDLRNLDVRNATRRQTDEFSENETGEIIAVPFSTEGMAPDLQEFVDTGDERKLRIDTAASVWMWQGNGGNRLL